MQLKDTSLFRQQAYIDGAWLGADSGQAIKVSNPATNEILGTVPKMGAAETRRAIEAADKALPAWRALTAKERSNKLRRWFELMIENQDDLARLMTLEQGKPLAEAKGEITYAASFIEWFAEEAQARLWRHHSRSPAGQAPDRDQAADRRDCGHHSVELPCRDDHPQGGSPRWLPVAPWCSSLPRRRRSRRWRWLNWPSARVFRRVCSVS